MFRVRVVAGETTREAEASSLAVPLEGVFYLTLRALHWRGARGDEKAQESCIGCANA